MLEEIFLDIYPERDSNVEYDASMQGIFRKRDGALITINESALLIWQLCDGTQSIDEIINSICSNYALNQEEAINSIVPLLQHLHDQQCLGFIQRAPGFTPPLAPPLINYVPIPGKLLKRLDQYLNLPGLSFPAGKKLDDSSLSEATLNQIINKPQARSHANTAWTSMKLVNIPEQDDLIKLIANDLREFIPVFGKQLRNSGRALYGAGGSMSWHTNEDLPGLRIYCIWSEKAGTNFFRYRNPDTGEIITQLEPAGWVIKSFYIPPRPRQLWHCIYAGSRRIALGFADFEFTRIDKIIS